LQELWDVCQDEFEVPGSSATTDVTEPTDVVLAQAFMLSAAVHSGAASGKTMQFQGSIQGHPILIRAVQTHSSVLLCLIGCMVFLIC